MIDNWNSILTTYRTQTDSFHTTAFSYEMTLYNKVVAGFVDFQNKQQTTRDAGALANDILSGLTGIYILLDILGAFGSFSNPLTIPYLVAKGVLFIIYNSVQYSYIRASCNKGIHITSDIENAPQFKGYNDNICQHFNNNEWSTIANFFTDACSLQIDFQGKADISEFYGHVCTSLKTNPLTSDYPGGVEGSNGGQTLLQFLQSNTKYLTFGANAPTTLTWTSNIESSITHKTAFKLMSDSEIGLVGDSIDNFVGVDLRSKKTMLITQTQNIKIGQASSKTASSQRTVTITLDDEDVGKFL